MKKKIIITVLLVITFIFLDTILLDGFLNKNVDNQAIETVLMEHCNCENITKEVHSTGLSIKNWVYGDYHSFSLTNCDFENFDDYVKEIHKQLQESIPNFCEADLVELRFKLDTETDRAVFIRDCILSIKNNQ